MNQGDLLPLVDPTETADAPAMAAVAPLFGTPDVLNTNAETDSGLDYSPQLTTDGQGNWVAVWDSEDPLGGTLGTDNDILFARSTDAGQTWSDPLALNTNADSDVGADSNPQLTTDGQGNWVAVWDSENALGDTIGTDKDILFAISTDEGQTWTDPQALNIYATTDADIDITPQLTTDRLGNWVVVWHSENTLGDTIGTDTDILFARSSTDDLQTWTTPLALNTNAPTDTGGDYLPELTTDGKGNWITVWQSADSLADSVGTDNDILFSRSTDEGQTWAAPLALNTNADTDTGTDSEPQLATDGRGNWVAVWDSDDPLDGTPGEGVDIFFAQSADDGLTWSDPQLLNTDASTDFRIDYQPQVTTDNVGNWMVVWHSKETLGGTIGIDSDILFAHSTDGGQSWIPTQVLNDYATTDSSWDSEPQLTTDGVGNWVAVWTSDHILGGTTGTESDLFFARAILEGDSLVTVTAIDPDAGEPANDGVIRVQRTGATDESLVVDFVVSGTATRDGDYQLLGVSGDRVTIPAGETFVDVTVDVSEDGFFELTESVVITLVEGPLYQVGMDGSASVDIADNDMKMQIVSGAQPILEAPSGGALDAVVQYTTSDINPALTSLGLRIHFDSSFLTYGQLDGLLTTGLIADPSAPMADTHDFDNDPNTDSYVLVAWVNAMGNWPGEALPVDLFTAQFTLAAGLETGSSTQIHFSASDTTYGYTLGSSPIEVVVAPTGNLDVDLDGEVRPSTDGILIMRYLFEFTGDTLISRAYNPAGERTDPAEIVDYLDGQRTKMLDVDGDGVARASTDGILILRYLFGYTGETLIAGVVNQEGSRTLATEIVAFLDGSLPPVVAPMPQAISAPDATSDDPPLAAPPNDFQIVYTDPEVQTIPPGDPVSIDVLYTTSLPLEPALTTLGIRMHYNSTLLTSTGVINLLAFGQVSDPSPPTSDTQDLDGDPTTDTYILFGWSDIMGNWPGTLPTTLFTANFATLPEFTDGTTSINFSVKDTTFGWNFDSTPAQITAQGAVTPTADPGGPYSILEGQGISLDGSASSDSDGGIVDYLWDLDNDGQYDDATGVNPIVSWSALDALSLPTNGIAQIIGLRVEDGDGQVDTKTTTLTIDNVAPTVNAGVDTSIGDGMTFTRLGSFTDPGPDTWTATVDYDDGSGLQTITPNADKTFDLVHDFPAGQGSYTVSVTVVDSDGGSTQDSFLVNVGFGQQQVTPNPVNQTLTFDQMAGGDAVSFEVVYTTVPEDPTLSGLGLQMHFDSSKISFDSLTNVLGTSFFQQQGPSDDVANDDLDPDTDQFILVAWTDVSDPSWPGTLPSILFTANFTALDQVGSTTVNFTAPNTQAGWSFSSTPATIQFNNRPVADAGGPYLADEGGTVVLDATASTDPDQLADTLLYEWDLDGDGLFGETGVDALQGDETGSQPTFSSIGLDNPNTLNVAVRVTDAGGLTEQSSSTVDIQNVAPSVNAGADATINEGAAFIGTGSFTDPGLDEWTATVDYGDGSGIKTLALNPDKSFPLAHTYRDNGQFTVAVTVTDDDPVTNTHTSTLVVTVQNVVPNVNAIPNATVSEGDAFTQTVSFTDPGADTWTVTVDYDDGLGTQTWNQTTKSFDLSHTYMDDGVYTVTVTVSDDDGASTDAETLLVTVQNVAPVVNAGPDVQVVGSANPFAVSGSFTDPGLDTWTVTVDYGDNSGTQTLTPTDKTFALDHGYSNGGVYIVTVTVTDDNNDVGTDHLIVTVLSETNLDVDANGSVEALSDGIIILRYLADFTGDVLIDQAIDPNATRNDPAEIIAYLDAHRLDMLDVDANGESDMLTDGILILRYLFGFSDELLVENALALDPPAQRTDPTSVTTFLDSWNTSASASPAAAPVPLASPDAFSQLDVTDAALSELSTTVTEPVVSDDIYSALAYEAANSPQSTPTQSNPGQSQLLATYDEWN